MGGMLVLGTWGTMMSKWKKLYGRAIRDKALLTEGKGKRAAVALKVEVTQLSGHKLQFPRNKRTLSEKGQAVPGITAENGN